MSPTETETAMVAAVQIRRLREALVLLLRANRSGETRQLRFSVTNACLLLDHPPRDPRDPTEKEPHERGCFCTERDWV